MKPSKMLELVENLKVGEKVVIEKFESHLFVEKKKSEVRPFEDGDILYGAKTSEYSVESISIYRDEETTYFHWNMTDDRIRHWAVPCAINSVLATDAQKQLLFDRLAKDGKRWDAETKQLEDLNEPKVGDDVIVWNEPRNRDASIARMTVHSAFIWDRIVKWDGTKEQFDRIRKGGNK